MQIKFADFQYSLESSPTWYKRSCTQRHAFGKQSPLPTHILFLDAKSLWGTLSEIFVKLPGFLVTTKCDYFYF